MDKKEVAVVILNWNGAHLLQEFLPSVLASLDDVAELVVADNGSTDASLQILQAQFPTVRCIALDTNYGFAEGYNRALNIVRNKLNSKVYVLLNSDVATPGGWLPPLLACLQSNAQIAAVMPKICSYHSPTSFEYAGAAGGFLDGLGYPYCRGRIFSSIEQDSGQYDTPLQIDWASGAALVVRADCYWEVGGLESRFFAHMEEIDFCWRLRRAGYLIYCEPRAKVFHLGGGSLPNSSPRKVYLNFRNSLLMLHRNWAPGFLRCCKLFLRFHLDMIAAILFLCTGKFSFSSAVFRAYSYYFRRRKDYPYLPTTAPEVQSRGVRSIVWEYYLRRRRHYDQL